MSQISAVVRIKVKPGRGDDVIKAFEGARERVRRFLNASSLKEVVFTRGTTESVPIGLQAIL